MPSQDSLRTLVERYDRANARRNRLTDAVVLPARPGAAVRRVCGSCWHVVDEQAEISKWEAITRAECGCLEVGIDARPSWFGWQHWFSAEHRWITHMWPGVTVCPNCGADALAEVTP